MHQQFDFSEKHKIAYLIMRKCGCSSIRHAISRIRDSTPIEPDQNRIHVGEKSFVCFPNQLSCPEKWFKFTIVRDPIRRFLSFYSNKILNQDLCSNHTFLHYDRFGLLPNMSIDQVIQVLTSGEYQLEPHIAPQKEAIAAVGYPLDYVGKLEQLSRALTEIQQHTGIKLESQKLNENRQPYVLPTRSQFNQLADYYREDIDAYGYPDDFDEWYSVNVSGKENRFQMEAGFTFENEAKLLRHQVSVTAAGFLLEMTWRVDPRQQRKRVVRVGLQRKLEFELLWHLPPKWDLRSQCDEEGILREQLVIPFGKLPHPLPIEDMYHQLYFAAPKSNRALLLDYQGHDNMLLMPFGHLQNSFATARAA